MTNILSQKDEGKSSRRGPWRMSLSSDGVREEGREIGEQGGGRL